MQPKTPSSRRSIAREGVQGHAKSGSARGLLPIYLGKRTSERVLAGQAKRGTGEKIHAVIWLCDMRDSTLLSESMPIEGFFALLSDFFDCTAGAVLTHGGEILSYIGDAVLRSSLSARAASLSKRRAPRKRVPAQRRWPRPEMRGRG